MLAHVVTLQSEPADVIDVVGHFREALLPILQRQPGYHGATVLTDPGAGAVVTIITFETAAAMDAFAASADHRAYEAARAAGMRLMTAPPTFATYQVSLRD